MWGEMSHLRFVCTTGGVVPLTAGVGLTITSRSSLRSCTSIIACRQASDTGEIQTEINGEMWGDMGRSRTWKSSIIASSVHVSSAPASLPSTARLPNASLK